jgi:hypothetical protein
MLDLGLQRKYDSISNRYHYNELFLQFHDCNCNAGFVFFINEFNVHEHSWTNKRNWNSPCNWYFFISCLSFSLLIRYFYLTAFFDCFQIKGIRRSWMYRIYIYEAFVLVLSSSLLGVIIGIVVAVTMTMQQSLFTQLPIPFTFPTTILLVVFVCSIIFSVLASFSPIRNVMNKSVVQIFRILN